MEPILSGKAKLSLRGIYDYISQDNKLAAQKTLDKIYNIIDLIQKNPYIGIVGRDDNTREFFIPSTSYFIVYTIDKNTLYIVNIIHTAKKY